MQVVTPGRTPRELRPGGGQAPAGEAPGGAVASKREHIVVTAALKSAG